ncbi:hypothetical protein ABK040_012147 [Willaertia magna]
MSERKHALFDDIGSDEGVQSPQHQSLDFFEHNNPNNNNMPTGFGMNPNINNNRHSSTSPMNQSMNNNSTSFFGGFFGGGNNNNSSGDNNFPPMMNNLLNFGNNNFATDFMLQTGVNHIYGVIDNQSNNISSRYWLWFDSLKCYFNVTNNYVSSKLLMLIFPFRKFNIQSSQQSNHQLNNNNNNQQQSVEERNLNDPDLYIPIMSFITYILLVCFIMGIYNEFIPDLLATIATRGLMISLFEIGLLKFGFYMLDVTNQNISFLDCSAISSYKYVGMVLTILITSICGSFIYYPICIYLSICMAVFMIKTLRKTSTHQDMRLKLDQNVLKRNYFIFIVALLQIPIYLLLTFYYSKPLATTSVISFIQQLTNSGNGANINPDLNAFSPPTTTTTTVVTPPTTIDINKE